MVEPDSESSDFYSDSESASDESLSILRAATSFSCVAELHQSLRQLTLTSCESLDILLVDSSSWSDPL